MLCCTEAAVFNWKALWLLASQSRVKWEQLSLTSSPSFVLFRPASSWHWSCQWWKARCQQLWSEPVWEGECQQALALMRLSWTCGLAHSWLPVSAWQVCHKVWYDLGQRVSDGNTAFKAVEEGKVSQNPWRPTLVAGLYSFVSLLPISTVGNVHFSNVFVHTVEEAFFCLFSVTIQDTIRDKFSYLQM